MSRTVHAVNAGGFTTLQSLMDQVIIDPQTQCWIWQGPKQRRKDGRIFAAPVPWSDTTRSTAKAMFGLFYNLALADEDRVYRIGCCETDLCISPHHRAVKTTRQGNPVIVVGSSDPQRVCGFAQRYLMQDCCGMGHAYTPESWRMRLVRSALQETPREHRNWPNIVFSPVGAGLQRYRMQRHCSICLKSKRRRNRDRVPDDNDIAQWAEQATAYLNAL